MGGWWACTSSPPPSPRSVASRRSLRLPSRPTSPCQAGELSRVPSLGTRASLGTTPSTRCWSTTRGPPASRPRGCRSAAQSSPTSAPVLAASRLRWRPHPPARARPLPARGGPSRSCSSRESEQSSLTRSSAAPASTASCVPLPSRAAPSPSSRFPHICATRSTRPPSRRSEMRASASLPTTTPRATARRCVTLFPQSRRTRAQPAGCWR
mmetsp:Transcript_39241/g.123736  ORF Transcript_39241/g.123736 Transcript_39241/m.123736 type:complete len:210 (-) Transcript_39241:3342-3971(-)